MSEWLVECAGLLIAIDRSTRLQSKQILIPQVNKSINKQWARLEARLRFGFGFLNSSCEGCRRLKPRRSF